MYTDKFIHEKPFKKTLKAIGSSMRVYIHGDSSCEGVIMRAGQPFSLRYPLVEIEGSYGNPMETGNWAAPRYTSSRLSSLAGLLFSDINKNTRICRKLFFIINARMERKQINMKIGKSETSIKIKSD